jgi:hypothetical protein
MTTSPTTATGAEAVGSFEVLPCPICFRDCERPLVRPGEPVKAGLSFVLDLGTFAHPDCAEAYNNGRLQARMTFGEAA